MKKIIILLVLAIVGFAIISVAFGYVASIFFKQPFEIVLMEPNLYIVSAVVVVASIIGILIADFFSNKKNVLRENNYLENSHWLTLAEMRKNKGFTVTKFSKLDQVKDGVPIQVKKSIFRKDFDVVLLNGIHTLVVGATGSGKTTAFVSPTIEVLARTKTKPSLLITDPKGELFSKHFNTLNSLGYRVSVIDLTDIMYSTRWNPLSQIIEKTKDIGNVDKKIKCERGRYYIGDKEYITREDARKVIENGTSVVENDIFIDLQDFIYTMCPISSKNDSSWETAGRDFILGILLAMWEDLRDGIMQADDFNLYNLYKNITEYATGECEVLESYVATRTVKSKVKGLTNTVIEAKDKTKASYLATVSTYMAWLVDSGITALTSKNDINLDSFDEEPSVLFMKIPDDKQNRYRLATLFITQLYKALIGKSESNKRQHKTDEQKLLRNVYLIMDEFGNLPKLPIAKQVATIGRGRGIFMVPIIQDFNQLYSIYGKDDADTIRSNCPIQMFIGTNDKNTIELFSQQCGKRKVRSISTNANSKDTSVSASATSVPLIYPSELERLNDAGAGRSGNIVAIRNGDYPIKSKIEPLYKYKNIYGYSLCEYTKGKFIDFDESSFYDISDTVDLFGIKQRLEEPVESIEERNERKAKEKEIEQYTQKEKIYKNALERQVNNLKGRVPDTDLELLKFGYYNTKISLLEKIVKTTEDRFLLYDITKLLEFIQTNFEFERVEVNMQGESDNEYKY